jgi:tetratricopeptide (TPR) repeat protein
MKFTESDYESMIENALCPGDYIDDRDESEFISELESVAAIFEKLQPSVMVLSLYETFLAGCAEKADEVHDGLGSYCNFVRSLFLAWIRTRQALKSNPLETADRLLRWMDNDPYGHASDLVVESSKLLDKAGIVAMEAAITARLEALQRDQGLEQEKLYLIRRWRSEIKSLYVEKGPIEKYIQLCEADEVHAKDCLIIATRMKKKGKFDQALNWVMRGIDLENKSKKYSGSNSELQDLRCDLLAKLGLGEEALTLAFEKFKSRPSIYSYENLFKYVPAKEKTAWHQKAMEVTDRTSLDTALEIWNELGEFNRVITGIDKATTASLRAMSHVTLEPVAVFLEQKEPYLAAKVHSALGMRILESKKSKYYQSALNHLASAMQLYSTGKGQNDWASLVEEIQSLHGRKKSFMYSFEKILNGKNSKEPSFLEKAKKRWGLE